MLFIWGYTDVFFFIIFAIFLSCVLFLISYVVSPKILQDIEKVSSYECGFEPFNTPFNSASITFDVHFYIVAILFLIFDLEVAYLFPWAISLRHIGYYGYFLMFVFLSVLTLGFIYEWFKGALD